MRARPDINKYACRPALTSQLPLPSTYRTECPDYPPAGYEAPPFPSLYWPPQAYTHPLYTLWDAWRFTTIWTLMLYGIFHLAAAGIALLMQVGKGRSAWKFIWAVPLVYALIAGLEAAFAGSIVGLV